MYFLDLKKINFNTINEEFIPIVYIKLKSIIVATIHFGSPITATTTSATTSTITSNTVSTTTQTKNQLHHLLQHHLPHHLLH